MAKKLIIAEKPTLARLIVGSLKWDDFKQEDGYYEGRTYVVTYAFGHLFTAYDIENYIGEEGRKWTLDILPFCPPDKKFLYQLIKKRNDKGQMVTDPGIKKQFYTIRSLINRKDISSIVHAGDADREGEILLRLVIRNANPSGKYVERLWVQEQTEEEIRRGMSALQPDSNFDNLSNEGFARSYTDWLDGINLTRYFSIKAKAPVGKPFRLGRVICAMTKEIYDRDMEIKNFVPVPYYAVISTAETNGHEITLRCKGTFPDDALESAEDKCLRLNITPATVSDVKTERKTIGAGKLYSLTSLQNALLKRHKIPLTKSKALIQSVYEKGYITYPRTNTEYLGESEKEKVKALIDVFEKQGYSLAFKSPKSIFDSSKIESHSAIIPTYKIPVNLSSEEMTVYTTVRDRFLAVFCAEPCLVDRTTITIICAEEKFVLKGDVLVQPGFTRYDAVKISEKTLPLLNIGDVVNVDFKPVHEETKPPKHYTAVTFNAFLLNPFRKNKGEEEDTNEGTAIPVADTEENDDELYKAILAGVEIGTVASRTDIIAKIIQNSYIEENKGTYTIAPAGIYLVESMALLGITMDKNTTAQMSMMLKRVNHGELTIEDAIDACMGHLREIMSHRDIEIPGCVETGAVAPVNQYGKSSVGKCPVCGADVYETPKTFSCEKNRRDSDECNFYLYKEDKRFMGVFKHKMTKSAAEKILAKGRYKEKGAEMVLGVDRPNKRGTWTEVNFSSSGGYSRKGA